MFEAGTRWVVLGADELGERDMVKSAVQRRRKGLFVGLEGRIPEHRALTSKQTAGVRGSLSFSRKRRSLHPSWSGVRGLRRGALVGENAE